MDWWPQVVVIGVMAVTAVIGVIAVRRLTPKLRRWLAPNRKTDIVFSVLMIIWGGGVWSLIVARKSYNNTFAVVMASFLLCFGLYILVTRLKAQKKF